jgi:superfamily II DNA or RNA helicase
MSDRLAEYRAFIASKHAAQAAKVAIQGATISPLAKAHQRTAIDFALAKGRAALFLDTGLGKSFCQLEFARIASEDSGKPALILAPLAVAAQMVREAHKFGIEARQIREQSEAGPGINVSNYERLPKLDPSAYGAVCLDESSILKAFQGTTRKRLQAAFENTPYRLALTATPAPNDHMELGQHAEFLGVMNANEMLARWFISDQTKMGAYRLKGHAVGPFWEWVASWARAAVLPSDLGGDDTGYILPDVDMSTHEVSVDLMEGAADGMLFRIPDQSATAIHKEKELTLEDRCKRVAELADHGRPVTIWCERNDESRRIAQLIPDAREVRGDMTPDQKEALLLGFADGDYRVIVSKPKLAGFGVNWQHCAHVIFGSITHSYEQFYQALRRSHRFGQSEQVRCDVVFSQTERDIWNNIRRKAKDHESMKENMRKAMRGAQSESDLHRKHGALKIRLPEFIQEETAQ